MRASVFLVMLIWTMYRFERLEHAIRISEHFYSYTGTTAGLAYMLAIAELLLLTAFVLGMAPRTIYGIVFLVQAISTFPFTRSIPAFANPRTFNSSLHSQCSRPASHCITSET